MTAGHGEAKGPASAEGGPLASSAGGQRGAARGRPAAGVLADRMAAALVHREPGWRLPRRTALARRFNVSPAEIDVAIDALARRSLLRRLPDGQVYRASAAEYLIPIEGLAGLGSRLDPMGAAIACASRSVSRRRAPEDISWVLGMAPGGPVDVIRCLWTADGAPAAFSTTYAADRLAGQLADPHTPRDQPPSLDSVLNLPPPGGSAPAASPETAAGLAVRPSAVHVEMRPPQPSITRSLRLAAGQPAVAVTIRFDDPSGGSPLALTVAVLRPDLFRIVVEAPASPPEGDSGAGTLGSWAHAGHAWEL